MLLMQAVFIDLQDLKVFVTRGLTLYSEIVCLCRSICYIYLYFFFITAALPHTKCERTFEKVGCFKDNTKRGMRTLPDLLVNDRDKSSDAHDGHQIDWHAWEESMLR